MTDFTHFWHMPPKKKHALVTLVYFSASINNRNVTKPSQFLTFDFWKSRFMSAFHISPLHLDTRPAWPRFRLIWNDTSQKKKELQKLPTHASNCQNHLWHSIILVGYSNWLIGIQIVRYNPTNRFFGSHFLPMKMHRSTNTQLGLPRPAPIGPSLRWA